MRQLALVCSAVAAVVAAVSSLILLVMPAEAKAYDPPVEYLYTVRGPNSNLLVTSLNWNRRVLLIAEHTYDGQIPSPLDLYTRSGGDEERMHAISAEEMARRVGVVVSSSMNVLVNPATFDGFIIHDIEQWDPYFRRYNINQSFSMEYRFKQMLLTQYPQVLRDASGNLLQGDALTIAVENEYERAARIWVTSLLSEMRRRVPLAKQGWYHMPMTGYWDANNPPVRDEQRRIQEEQMAWFWPQVDFLCPNGYERYRVMPDSTPPSNTDIRTVDDRNLKMWRADEVERVRLQTGKPCYWILSLFVENSFLPIGTTVTDAAITNTIDALRSHRPTGIILWGWTEDGSPSRIQLMNSETERWENGYAGI